mgnify:CR=1 FL=1
MHEEKSTDGSICGYSYLFKEKKTLQQQQGRHETMLEKIQKRRQSSVSFRNSHRNSIASPLLQTHDQTPKKASPRKGRSNSSFVLPNSHSVDNVATFNPYEKTPQPKVGWTGSDKQYPKVTSHFIEASSENTALKLDVHLEMRRRFHLALSNQKNNSMPGHSNSMINQTPVRMNSIQTSEPSITNRRNNNSSSAKFDDVSYRDTNHRLEEHSVARQRNFSPAFAKGEESNQQKIDSYTQFFNDLEEHEQWIANFNEKVTDYKGIHQQSDSRRNLFGNILPKSDTRTETTAGRNSLSNEDASSNQFRNFRPFHVRSHSGLQNADKLRSNY